MFSPFYLRQIIRVSLEPLILWSDEAEELLLLTAAHESHLGEYLHQINGDALGIYQMEPDTLVDIWENYIKYRPSLGKHIAIVSGVPGVDLSSLQYNPIYSTIMARVHYRRQPGRLPGSHEIPEMAEYAKQFYNTPAGKATTEQYESAYYRLILS